MVDDGVMEDGVSLTSDEHPHDPKTIERLCRVVCKAQGVNPDIETEGLGVLMPKGQLYKLWEAQRATVQAVLDELAAIDSELQFKPESVETISIEVAPLAGTYMGRKPGETVKIKLRP